MESHGDIVINRDFIKTPTLSANEKIVYIVLMSYCSYGKKECSPSIRSELTIDTGLSARSIIVMLKGLEDKGFIGIIKNGGRSPNTYLIKEIK